MRTSSSLPQVERGSGFVTRTRERQWRGMPTCLSLAGISSVARQATACPRPHQELVGAALMELAGSRASIHSLGQHLRSHKSASIPTSAVLIPATQIKTAGTISVNMTLRYGSAPAPMTKGRQQPTRTGCLNHPAVTRHTVAPPVLCLRSNQAQPHRPRCHHHQQTRATLRTRLLLRSHLVGTAIRAAPRHLAPQRY